MIWARLRCVIKLAIPRFSRLRSRLRTVAIVACNLGVICFQQLARNTSARRIILDTSPG